MSDAGEGATQREVAYRLFAAEYDDADLSYSEGEEERAPNYVVTPTGARVNRLFVVGVLTEVEAVSEDVLRARVVDPTGAFVLYAGQYQPDEQAFLERAQPPTFVAVTGKARTFRPEDGDRVYTSVRPESINEVDAETRDRWTVGTAERTLERVGWTASALASDRHGDDLEAALVADGAEDGFASGIVRALAHYDTSPAYLAAVREMALNAARLVAGEIDEVDPVSMAPDASGDADLAALAEHAGPDRATGAAGSDASHEVSTTPEPTAETATVSAGGSAETAREGSETATGESETQTLENTDAPARDGSESGEDGPGDGTAMGGNDPGAVGDFEPGEFELDEEEREEIESEFGTEFQSGTEVDEPGETDIETPDPDTPATEPTTDGESTTAEEEAPMAGEESPIPDEGAGTATDEVDADEGAESVTDDETEDVDLEDATLDVMSELDDGAGADRETVLDTVAQRYGVGREEVEAAIQDALMDGRCYEPDDATLKPI